MLNVLVLGHSFIEQLRKLYEDDRKPHQWEDPTNCAGRLHVQFHGYPGGRANTLTKAIEGGLFIHYLPHIVILQIGGNDCSMWSFDEKKFEEKVDKLISACVDRDVMVLFMSILERSNPKYCTPEDYNTRREKANAILRKKGEESPNVFYFKPRKCYDGGCPATDGVHFTDYGYLKMLRAMRKGLSWCINSLKN